MLNKASPPWIYRQYWENQRWRDCFCGGKAENGSQGTQGAQNEQYTQGGMDINPDTSDFEEIVDDNDDLPF